MDNFNMVHDSYDLGFRKPFGAVPCGEKVELCLAVSSNVDIDRVYIRLLVDGTSEMLLEMPRLIYESGKMIFRGEFTAPYSPGLLWYYFIIKTRDMTWYYGNNQEELGGVGAVYNYPPKGYQITVYKRGFETPKWFKDSIIYQVFLDRFFNGNEDGSILNPRQDVYIHKRWDESPFYIRDSKTQRVVKYDFFGGNIPGLIKKLPYLKALGINLIYLNPIFEAESNHKYDTGDYNKIDPMFGDNNDFNKLCSAAGEMGINIILDGVFNHTGSNSIYFNKYGKYNSIGACDSKESPYFKWYSFSEYPNKYECWWGVDTLPSVNEMEPTYRDFIISNEDSVLRHWMKFGAKGWRLDVADELPDEFIREFKSEMRNFDSESILIGEVWEDASNKISYGVRRNYLFGEELDSVMNYPFREIMINFILGKKNSHETHKRLMSLYENYPLHHFYSNMNLIGSHDVPRILTILGEAPDEKSLSESEKSGLRLDINSLEKAIKRLKLLSLIQMTFPGVPSIYYGDEAGLEGFGDPLNRGTYPWCRENHELIGWYKKIIKLRNENDFLRTGKWISIHPNDDVYGYIRLIENSQDVFGEPKKNGAALILINRNDSIEVNMVVNLKNYFLNSPRDILTDDKILLGEGRAFISLKPLEGKIFFDEE